MDGRRLASEFELLPAIDLLGGRVVRLEQGDFARETTFSTDRLAVALDVRGGLAIGEGWRSGATGVPPDEAIRRLADVGVATFEVTSISRDGLLGGPDLAMLGQVVDLGRGRVIASGGVARVEDIDAACPPGLGSARA